MLRERDAVKSHQCLIATHSSARATRQHGADEATFRGLSGQIHDSETTAPREFAVLVDEGTEAKTSRRAPVTGDDAVGNLTFMNGASASRVPGSSREVRRARPFEKKST